MSLFSGDVVDSKVVEMSLDNQRFERNANDSISTISKLKNALDFSDAGKGFDDLNRSIKGINTDGLSNGIAAISNGFTAMEGIAFGVLTRIGSKIADVSMKVVDMFAVAPIRDGFSKYELKMNSVQTIMASTGESLETVNKFLQELNDYSDKTIYSFSDMTSNIGKFTNAGVKLEDAVKAIQGISNEAAVSGANANEAARAMYNFAQALSAGYVKLIDWKSIENANMATVEFKNQLLETANELGTVKKQADGTYKVLTHGNGSKGMQDTISATKLFNDSLSQQWMTSEVLTTTLAKYADETTEIGKKASNAATEVKTFSQMLSVLKELASTGWTQSWEILVGDFEQSKELFTYFSNTIGGIIGNMTKARNEFLRAGMDAPKEYVKKEDWEALGLTESKAKSLSAALIEVGKNSGIKFADESVDGLVDSLSQGWLTAEKLKEALKLGGGSVDTSKSVKNLEELHEAALKVIRGGENGYSADMGLRFEQLTADGFDPQQVQDYVNTLHELAGGTWNLTEEIWAEADATIDSTAALAAKSDEELKALGWSEKRIKNLRKLQKQAEETGTPLNELIEKMEAPKKSGRENLFESIQNIFSGVGKMITMIKRSWSSIFPKASGDVLYSITEKIRGLSESFKKFAIYNGNKIYRFFKGLFSLLDIGVRIVKTLAVAGFNVLKNALSVIGPRIMEIAARIGDLLFQFRNWVIENEIIEKAIAFLGNAINGVIGTIRGFIDAFLNLPIVSKNISRFKNAFKIFAADLPGMLKGGKERIEAFIGRVKEMGGLKLENLPAIFKDFKDNVLSYFMDFPGFKAVSRAFNLLVSDVKKAFGSLGGIFKDWLYKLREKVDGTIFADIIDGVVDFVQRFIASFHTLKDKLPELSISGIFDFIKDIAGGLIDFISKIKWGKIFKIGVGLTAVLGVFGVLKKALKLLKGGKNFLTSITDTISSFGKVNEAKALEKKSKALTNFAIAIGIMTAAIYILTTLDPNKLLRSVAVLTYLSVLMVGVIYLISKIGKSKGLSVKTSIALIAIAASVAILAGALKTLESLSSENLLRNLLVLTALVGGMVVVAVILSKHAKKLSTGGIGLILFVASIRLLIGALAAINELDLKPGTLGTLLAMMLGLAAVSAIAKKAKLGSGLSLVLTAASIIILVQAVKQLGEIKKEKLKRGLVAITVLGIVVMAIAGVLGLVSSHALGMLGGAASLLLVAGSILLLALAIKSLANVDPAQMTAATLCLSILIGMMTLALAVTSMFKSIPVGLVVMVAVVGLLALILGLMSKFKVKKSFENAKALSLLLISMSASLVLLSVVGMMGAGALIGILSMIALIAAMGLLAVGIGALVTKFPKIKEWLNKGLPILYELAKAIGKIIEAFLSGITDAVMNTLLKIPPFLKEFLTGMKEVSEVGTFNFLPLLEAVGAVLLVGVVGLISSIMSAASQFLTGKSAVEQFGDDLTYLSGALKQYSEDMTAIDGLDIPAGGIAELALIILGIDFVGLIDAISSKVTDLLIGKTPMEDFSYNLGLLSAALVDWQTKMEGLKEIDIPSDSIDELTRIVGNISLQGLLWSVESLVNEFINGKSNVEQFSSDITSLATALSTWQSTINSMGDITIPTEGIISLEGVISAISFAGVFSSVGSIVNELINGKDNVEQFSTDITELGIALSTWSSLISENTNITVDSTGIQNLIDAVNLIPAQKLSETILAKFSGQSAAEKFGSDVGVLATAVNGYVTALQDVDITDPNITASTNLISMLGTLTGNLPDSTFIEWISGETRLSKFAEHIPDLAPAIVAYSDSLKDVEITDKVAESTALISILGTLTGTLPAQTFIDWITGDTPLEKFAENLPALGTGLAGYAAALGSDFNSDATASATEAASLLSTIGTNLKGQNLGSSFLWVKNKSDIEKFGNNLGYLATGLNDFAEKINDPEELRSTTISATRMVEAGKLLSEIDLTTGDIAYDARVTMIRQNVGKLVAMIGDINDTSYDKVDTFKEAIEKITSLDLNTAVNKLTGNTDEAGKTAGDTFASSMSKGIESGSDDISATTTDVTNSIVGSLMESDSNFKTQGVNLIKALANGFKDVEGNAEVLEALKGVGSASVSVLSGYEQDFKDVGTSLSTGFAVGLNTFHAQLVVRAAAYAIGRAAIDSLKRAIDAHSPSRESAKLGEFFGIGFIGTIESFNSEAYKSGYGIGKYAREGLASATKAISAVLSSDLETQPVIRPVLDLSDIRSGSLAIGSLLNPRVPIGIEGNLNAINANVNARNMTSNADILTALNDLGAALSNRPVETNQYTINGITYDDGTNISEAVRSLIHAARVERRV